MARLTLGEVEQRVDVEVLGDPRLATTPEDYHGQFALGEQIWRALSESHRALHKARDVRRQIAELAERLGPAERYETVQESARRAQEALEAVESKITQTRVESSQDVLNFPPKLDNQLAALLGTVASGTAAPTEGSEVRYRDLRTELDNVKAELQQVIDTQVQSFIDLVEERQVPAVVVPAL